MIPLGVLASSVQPATGGFDPLSIGWHTAFWADQITGLSDGDPVAQWDDATGNGRHASQATGGQRPLYRPTAAGLNGRPAVQFDGLDDVLQTAAWTSIAQPNTIVSVMRVTGAVTVRIAYDGLAAGARHYYRIESNNTRYSSGTEVQILNLDRDLDSHHFVLTFDSPQSTFERDGVNWHTGDTGTNPLTGLTLGANITPAAYAPLEVAFLGVMNGTPTAQQKADLLAWSRDYYTTP